MSELRSVNPRDLKANPHNPRTIKAPPGLDEQLVASIREIGIIQPPVVRDIDGTLVITAGHRRVRAAISAGLPIIDVLVADGDDTAAAMEGLSENLVRVSMDNVDIWRAIERLEALGWSEHAIADALTQPVRTVRRLKLLAHVHPPMLEAMAGGGTPEEGQLRIIANASIEEQAQVWKKHKPKKGEHISWWPIVNALTKRHIPFAAAKFDDALAAKYGVTWHDDLFAPADQDSRYTTDVDGFFGAQQEWLEANLPKGGVIIAHDQYGHPTLPKKAERVYGKPAKGDVVGHFLDPRTAEVKTVVFRLPAEKKAAKGTSGEADAAKVPTRAPRPDVTQKGQGIIGDLRTDALHESLLQDPASDITLIGLLVLALGGRNVSIQSPLSFGRFDREATWGRIAAGGVLTQDHDAIRQAARAMLAQTLSCREGMSNSGVGALIAAAAIGADLRLPSMATEDFLSCLSRQALEREAAANGLRVEARVKDTRANMVSHFAEATWVYPGATFALTQEQIDAIETGGKTSGAEDNLDGGDDAPSEEGDDGYAEFADAAD